MSVFTRLYRGETRIDFIGTRRRWYLASLVMIVLCVLSIAFRGFNVGIDFKGGTQFQIKAANTTITTKQVEEAMAQTGHGSDTAAQEVGSGSTRQIVIKTKELKLDEQVNVQRKLAAALKVDPNNGVSVESVSSSWGSEITRKAIQGLVV